MADKSAPLTEVPESNPPAVAPAAPPPTKKVVVKKVVVMKKRSSLTGAVAPPSQPASAPSASSPTDSTTANADSTAGPATAPVANNTSSVSAKTTGDTMVAAPAATPSPSTTGPTPQPVVASASDSASLAKEQIANKKEEKPLEPQRSQKDQDKHEAAPKISESAEKAAIVSKAIQLEEAKTITTPTLISSSEEKPSEKSGEEEEKEAPSSKNSNVPQTHAGISCSNTNNTTNSAEAVAAAATADEAIRSLASAMVGAAMDSAAMESSLSAMSPPKEEKKDSNTCMNEAVAAEEPTAPTGEEANGAKTSEGVESATQKATTVVVGAAGVPPKAKPAPASTVRASSTTKGAGKSKTAAAASGVAKKTSPSPRPAVAKQGVPTPAVGAKTKKVAPLLTPIAPSSVAPEPADDKAQVSEKTSQQLPDPSSSTANPNPDPNVTASRRSSRGNSSTNKIVSEGAVGGVSSSSSRKASQLDKTKQTATSTTTSRAKSLPPPRSFSHAATTAKKGPSAPIGVGGKKKPQLSREELEAQHKARLTAMEEREKKRRAEAREQLAKVEASLGDVLTRAREYVVEAKEKERTERLERMAVRRQQREEEKERLEAARSLHPMAALLAAAAITNAVQALEREENASAAGEASHKRRSSLALPSPSSGPNDTQTQTPIKAAGSSVVSDSPARTRSPHATTTTDAGGLSLLVLSPAGGTSAASAATALLNLDLTPDHLRPMLAAYAQQEASRQRLQKASKIDAAREQEERRRAEEELAARRARLGANKFVPLSVLKQQQQQASDAVGEGEAQNGDNILQNVKENEKKKQQPQQRRATGKNNKNKDNNAAAPSPQQAKNRGRAASSSSSSSATSSYSASSSTTASLSTVSTPRTEDMTEEERQRIFGDLKKQREHEDGNAVVISADEREKEKEEEAKKLKDLQRRERRAERAEEKRANKKKAKLEEKKQLRMRMKKDVVDAAKQEEAEAKVHATRSDKGEKARKSVAIETAASAVANALKSNNHTPDEHEEKMAVESSTADLRREREQQGGGSDNDNNRSRSFSSSMSSSLSDVSSVSSVLNTTSTSSSAMSSTPAVHMNTRKGRDDNDERNRSNNDGDDAVAQRALHERIAEWKAQTKAARKVEKIDAIKKKRMEKRDEDDADEAENRKRRKQEKKKKKREEKDASHRHTGAEDDEKAKNIIPFGRLAARKEQQDLSDNSPLSKHNNNGNNSNFQTLEEIREQFLVERRANTRDFQIQQGILRRQHMFEYGRQVEQALFGGGNEAAANNESEIIAISPLKKRKQKHPAVINTTETAQKPQLSPEEELARHKKTVAIGNAYMREAKEKAKGSSVEGESSARPPAEPPVVLTSGGDVPDESAKKVKAIGDSYLREMAKKRKEMMKRNNNNDDASKSADETQQHTTIAGAPSHGGSSSPARLRPLAGAPHASNPLLSQEALERARKEVVALNRKMLLQPLKPLSESATSYAINSNNAAAISNSVSSHHTPFSAPTGGISGSEKGPTQGPSTVGGARRLPPLPASPSPSSPLPSGESPHDPIVDAINAKMRLLRMLEGNKASASSPSLGGAPSTLGPQRPPRTLKPLGNTK